MGMFGRGASIQLARLFGIRIGVSPSWFIVLFLMIFSLSGYFRDVLVDSTNTVAYVVAVSGAVLFFVSLVLHELGHALVARRGGIGIAGIDLWFFGGIAKMTRDTSSPGEEFRVAAAGPAVTLVVVLLCTLAAFVAAESGGFFDAAFFAESATTPALALLGWLAVVNTFLFAFNLIPAFPLDGGRITRAIAWKVTGDRNRGTRFSARLGQGFSYLLMGVGLVLLIRGDVVSGLWLGVLGWFLGQAASGAVLSSRFSERLEGLTVGDVMDAQPVSMPGDLPLLQAQDEFFLRYRWPWFPVVDAAGRYLGIVRQERVDGAMAGEAPALAVREVLDDEGAEGLSVRDDTPIEQLMGSEGLRRLGALMVVDAEQRLRGVVTVEQVRRAVIAAAPGHLA
jgi:Zn-dependent protease/CBS domain-containing protein